MSAPAPHRGTPKAEVEIDVPLVQALLKDQHPDLADLPLTPVDAGWDNVMMRLGDDLAVRLPRRSLCAELVRFEQKWLPELAPRLPLPVPTPIRTGRPGNNYPWYWSVVPWLDGVPADQSSLRADQALPLVEFLKALHQPAPMDAPRNPYRGVPLTTRQEMIEDGMRQLKEETVLITPAIEAIWQAALRAPIDSPPTWVHGDLHGRNVLTKDGAISGIIDWGDMNRGDRASDLACLWTLLEDRHARADAISAYRVPGSTLWTRAKGWAVMYGVVLSYAGRVDDPIHARSGEAILRRLEEDFDGEE